MSSKLYNKGKLTQSAQKKLQKRLEKENNKSKTNKFQKAKQSAPKVAKNVSKNKKVEIAQKPKQQTPERKTQKVVIKNKHKELTMDDIEDSPPPQKLVKARKEAMDQNNDVNWISLIGYNQIEAENEEKLYKKLETSSNARFRNDLEQQTKIKEAQRKKERAEKEKYRIALNQKFESFKSEDTAKMKANHEKMLKLKEIRAKQVDELNRRRKYEELKLRKQELREVEKTKKALEKEKIENKQKKEENMKKLKEMLVDNEKQKKIKEEIRIKEEAEAIRLQKEYAKMLKEQEEKREKRLKATYEKQQKKFNALISATSDVREKAEEDAKRAELEQRKREKLQDEKERAKKEKLRHEMNECKKAIDAQIKDKMAKIKQDILEDKEYGKKMTKLHAEYLQEIEDKKAEKLKKQQEQAQYLEAQIAALEKKKQEQRTEMSDTEKLLNKGLLDQVRNIKLSPNKKDIMMKRKEKSICIDPKKPFQWKYDYRKAPF